MKRLALVAALAFPLNAAWAMGPYPAPPSTFGMQPTDPRLHGGDSQTNPINGASPRVLALIALRNEGLRLRDADGGTLTPEHRAYLQKKLDAIQAEYHALPEGQ